MQQTNIKNKEPMASNRQPILFQSSKTNIKTEKIIAEITNKIIGIILINLFLILKHNNNWIINVRVDIINRKTSLLISKIFKSI